MAAAILCDIEPSGFLTGILGGLGRGILVGVKAIKHDPKNGMSDAVVRAEHLQPVLPCEVQ